MGSWLTLDQSIDQAGLLLSTLSIQAEIYCRPTWRCCGLNFLHQEVDTHTSIANTVWGNQGLVCPCLVVREARELTICPMPLGWYSECLPHLGCWNWSSSNCPRLGSQYAFSSSLVLQWNEMGQDERKQNEAKEKKYWLNHTHAKSCTLLWSWMFILGSDSPYLADS